MGVARPWRVLAEGWVSKIVLSDSECGLLSHSWAISHLSHLWAIHHMDPPSPNAKVGLRPTKGRGGLFFFWGGGGGGGGGGSRTRTCLRKHSLYDNACV